MWLGTRFPSRLRDVIDERLSAGADAFAGSALSPRDLAQRVRTMASAAYWTSQR